MYITLDITENFNQVINYSMFFDWSIPLNPVMFLEKSIQFNKTFSFQLMNFGLNIDDGIEKEFATNYPTFDNIIKCDFAYKSLIIFGQATISISSMKGLCLQLLDPGKPPYKEVYAMHDSKPQIVPSDGLYYEHPCIIKKGDYLFHCGGNSSFSNHFINAKFIAYKDTKVTITFSSEEYILKESCDEAYEKMLAKKQTPYYSYLQNIVTSDLLERCTVKKPKLLDVEYMNKYFGGFDIAICDELIS